MTEETRISKEIYEYALAHGVWQLARYQAQANLNGLPDRIFLYKGVLLGIEVKTPKGKATELQKRKLRMITEHGGIGVLVDKVEQFIWLINNINNRDADVDRDPYVWENEFTVDHYQRRYPHLSTEEKESV